MVGPMYTKALMDSPDGPSCHAKKMTQFAISISLSVLNQPDKADNGWLFKRKPIPDFADFSSLFRQRIPIP